MYFDFIKFLKIFFVELMEQVIIEISHKSVSFHSIRYFHRIFHSRINIGMKGVSSVVFVKHRQLINHSPQKTMIYTVQNVMMRNFHRVVMVAKRYSRLVRVNTNIKDQHGMKSVLLAQNANNLLELKVSYQKMMVQYVYRVMKRNIHKNAVNVIRSVKLIYSLVPLNKSKFKSIDFSVVSMVYVKCITTTNRLLSQAINIFGFSETTKTFQISRSWYARQFY